MFDFSTNISGAGATSASWSRIHSRAVSKSLSPSEAVGFKLRSMMNQWVLFGDSDKVTKLWYQYCQLLQWCPQMIAKSAKLTHIAWWYVRFMRDITIFLGRGFQFGPPWWQCPIHPHFCRWKNVMLSSIPSGYVKIAIENGHRNSGFTHWKWWFSIVVNVYQRVVLRQNI